MDHHSGGKIFSGCSKESEGWKSTHLTANEVQKLTRVTAVHVLLVEVETVMKWPVDGLISISAGKFALGRRGWLQSNLENVGGNFSFVYFVTVNSWNISVIFCYLKYSTPNGVLLLLTPK